MSITAIYDELHRRARETGEARGQTLTGGARLTVRVRERTTTLTISRKGKKVGDPEIVTFKRDCGVPDGAERRPNDGQGTQAHDGATWHYVSYRWIEGG